LVSPLDPGSLELFGTPTILTPNGDVSVKILG
jgi:hypothetical protein